ncbi:hypothetical protein VNO78_27006 [Psophocarpus tetragonolobus]|uniref:Abscisic acid receptor PYR1 n=1 Tax=Psophocarpus tetragonolobus TaxID=3891 RepID=A0AAN9XAI5_PSOTE
MNGAYVTVRYNWLNLDQFELIQSLSLSQNHSRYSLCAFAMDKTHAEAEQDPNSLHPTRDNPDPPAGLTPEEFADLRPSILEHHSYSTSASTRQCSSLLAQRVHAPPHAVWAVVRCFDTPQAYKHFIKSCHVSADFTLFVGSTRDVTVISGLPAATSTERLDLLDDDRHVIGFTIVGGEHRLRNYRSVTSVHGFHRDGKIWTVVLESYVVDVPEGNTEEDTRLFADTVVKLNLQKLASVTEGKTGYGHGTS